MKVQSTFYPNLISKTVDLLINSWCITKHAQIIDIWCIYAVNLREKMSQITHFCGVKFLAWKSGTVKFRTTNLSGKTDIQKAYILAPATFLPRKNTLKKNPMLSVTTPKIFAKHLKLATRSKNCHWPICIFCVSDTYHFQLWKVTTEDV